MMIFTAILLPILFVSAQYENNTALSSRGQGFGPANSTEVSPMRVAAADHFNLRGYIPPAASTDLLPPNSKPFNISAFKAKEEEEEEEDTSQLDRGLRRRKNKKKNKKKNTKKNKNRNKAGKKRNRNGNKKVKKNKKKGKSNKSSKRSKSKNGKR